MTLAESSGSSDRGAGMRGLAPHLSPKRTLVSLDLSAIGAGRARAYNSRADNRC